MTVAEVNAVAQAFHDGALGIEPAGAEAVTDIGKYIVVHETQDDGSTKIVLDIFNSNMPAGG